MVDPKKDYELLMRYLQGGMQKREPMSAPEPGESESWQTLPDTIEPSKEPAQSSHDTKQFVFHWPTWKRFKLPRNGHIAIAAVSLFVLSFLTWKMYSFYQLSPDSIYTQLYVPFQLSTADTAPESKNSIAYYFTSGNYVAATLQAKKQKQLSDPEKLLTGLSYIQRQDYPDAIKWLEPLSNNFKSACRQQAEFYVALAYLKNADYDHSIERLEQIYSTPTHLYHDRVSSDVISDIKILKWK